MRFLGEGDTIVLAGEKLEVIKDEYDDYMLADNTGSTGTHTLYKEEHFGDNYAGYFVFARGSHSIFEFNKHLAVVKDVLSLDTTKDLLISKTLRTKLKNMPGDPIASSILKLQGVTDKGIKNITLRSGERVLSYLPSGRECVLNSEGKWSREGRQTSKIGKLVKKLVDTDNEKEIEDFVNKLLSINQVGLTITIVQGETDIKKWYHHQNYASGTGTLESSCMKHSNKQDYFEMYIQLCKLVIVTNAQNLLISRALLWEIDGVKYLDRIYGNDTTILYVKDWAQKNDIIIKAEQSYNNKIGWVNSDGERFDKVLKVPCDNEFDHYPYVDTFTYFYSENGYFSNESDNDLNYLELTDLDGGHEDTPGDHYCCDHCGDDIPEDEECHMNDDVYCDDCVVWLETEEYCLRDEAVYTENDCLHRIEDCVRLFNGKWLHSDEARFCDYSSNYYSEDDVFYTVDGNDVHEDNFREALDYYGYVELENGDVEKSSDCFTCAVDEQYHLDEDLVMLGDNCVAECNLDDALEEFGYVFSEEENKYIEI